LSGNTGLIGLLPSVLTMMMMMMVKVVLYKVVDRYITAPCTVPHSQLSGQIKWPLICGRGTAPIHHFVCHPNQHSSDWQVTGTYFISIRCWKLAFLRLNSNSKGRY